MVAPDTTSPSPLVTSHPLDGEDQPALENVILDKVRLCLERVTKSALAVNKLLLIKKYLNTAYFYYAVNVLRIVNLKYRSVNDFICIG